MAPRIFILGTLAVLALARAAGPAVAQVSPAPTLTVAGQSVTFAEGIGIVDAPGARVSVLYPSKPLPPHAEAQARAAGSWREVATLVAPAAIVDLEFTPGPRNAMLNTLRNCRISAVGFRQAWSAGGSAKACHILSIGGFLSPNGGVMGLLQGEGRDDALRLPVSAWGSGRPAATASGTASTVTAKSPHADLSLGSVEGQARYTHGNESVRATHAIALWTQDGQKLRVELFDHPPSSGMLEAVRKGEYGQEAPVMTLEMRFKGSRRDLASVYYCYVDASFARAGPIGFNTTPEGCGLTALNTDARPGGTVQAVLKGGGNGPNGAVTWDLRLHVPIAR